MDPSGRARRQHPRHGLGLNRFFGGYANKLSAEATYVAQDDQAAAGSVTDHVLLTVQLAAGL